ncbi:hypothetical protein OG535_06155 [Kitasatospora sp. NBC_00085]|uniref:hypothetical protein n=1 Tax=unclassified Kitasatospora TaxID=2633591 RepID=UPI00324EEA31
MNWAVAAEEETPAPDGDKPAAAPSGPGTTSRTSRTAATGTTAAGAGNSTTLGATAPVPPAPGAGASGAASVAAPPPGGAAAAIAAPAPADPDTAGEAEAAGPKPGRVSRPMIAAAVAVGLVLVGGSVVATRLGGSEPNHGPARADAPPGYGPENGDGGSGFVPGFDQHGAVTGASVPPDATPGTPAPAGETGSPAPDPAAGQPAPATGPAAPTGGTPAPGKASPRSGGAPTAAGTAAPPPAAGGAGGGGGGSASGGAASGGSAGGAPQPPPAQGAAPPAAQQPVPPPAASKAPAPAPLVAVAGPYCSASGTTYTPIGWWDQGDIGWKKYSGGWSSDGCNGTYVSVPMSGDANKDDSNSVVWTFNLGNVKSCTLSVYIPADSDLKKVGGKATLYTVKSGSTSGSFVINQTANRGRWVDQTAYAYQGSLTVTLHTRGEDFVGPTKNNAHHAASAVKATCTS